MLAFGAWLLSACGNPAPASSADAAAVADAGASPDAGSALPDAGLVEADCSGLAAQPAGSTDWTLTSDGTGRLFRVHLPATYDPTRATALVLNFHGLQSSAAEQEQWSLMSDAADRDGYIVVYPQGTNALELNVVPPALTLVTERGFNAGKCCSTAQARGIDDVAFTARLLDVLESKLCVDPRRVFATGFSNGGYLAYRLACELSARIAAIAPVSAQDLTETCAPARPVPVLHFHGTADYVVPYDGNALYPGGLLLPVSATVDRWVAHDGCAAATTATFNQGDVDCEQHGACLPDPHATVTLCTIRNAGHTWPDGATPVTLGLTTRDIDADAAMWTFFREHPLP